ncbi:hypothetical protein V8V91_25785 [Algoriphagus halophilus]
MFQGRGNDKTKKSDLEDLQKTYARLASALFEQCKIISLDNY